MSATQAFGQLKPKKPYTKNEFIELVETYLDMIGKEHDPEHIYLDKMTLGDQLGYVQIHNKSKIEFYLVEPSDSSAQVKAANDEWFQDAPVNDKYYWCAVGEIERKIEAALAEQMVAKETEQAQIVQNGTKYEK
jgi:hypothetical protein